MCSSLAVSWASAITCGLIGLRLQDFHLFLSCPANDPWSCRRRLNYNDRRLGLDECDQFGFNFRDRLLFQDVAVVTESVNERMMPTEDQLRVFQVER